MSMLARLHRMPSLPRMLRLPATFLLPLMPRLHRMPRLPRMLRLPAQAAQAAHAA